MYVAGVQYTLSRRAFEIFISGCEGINGTHCKDCHNPELWPQDIGEELTPTKLKKIKDHIADFSDMVDSIMVFGGEVLEKPLKDVEWLLTELKELDKPLWLFTRFRIEEVPDIIMCHLDYIKCGPYIPSLPSDKEVYGIRLASSNQRIYKRGENF